MCGCLCAGVCTSVSLAEYEAIKSHDNAILIKINWTENFQQQRRPPHTYVRRKETQKKLIHCEIVLG